MPKLDVSKLEIRLLKPDDIPEVIRIDSYYSGRKREDYYQEKMNRNLDTRYQLTLSFAGCIKDHIVGFIMGEVSRGTYGLPEDVAAIDTIGIDPNHQKSGIAEELMDEFVSHARSLGVKKIYTLVNWQETGLFHYFQRMGFQPGLTLYLEKNL
ncbi:MAG: GNAT family N-acetyltransferase [Candidatus Eremiobacteraeota bacterium]|jgi:N-acetylglutamate synthase-like GNAT family acetyltransferase|nr:GNAT family N-acetyltransferase [Candidatus Eremiobacteraeota bacterium]